jgi:hypothetical protein
MKKIVLVIVMILGIVGCGINCPSKPPKRAYVFNDGGYGMSYHVAVYVPASQLSHNLTACTKYEYDSFHMYVDHFGTLNGDEIIWKNFEGGEIPFAENGEVQSDITVKIFKDKIVLSGFKDNAENGVYKIETTPPDGSLIPTF